MTYEQVKTLKPTEFKRLCGVYPDTIKDMVTVLKAEKVWQKKTGRPSKLSTEDQLLITLECWREYRTYFHRKNSWGINELTAYIIVRKVEDILIKFYKLQPQNTSPTPSTLHPPSTHLPLII